MNRDQAKAIIANLDIVKHFAEGGDLGYRLYTYDGELICISPTDKIILSNITPMSTHYVKVKTKYRWNPIFNRHERVQRCSFDCIDENELMPRVKA